LNFSVEDESENPPTTFNERGPEISAVEWEALLAKCRELAVGASWACLGGSVPPGLPADAYRTLGRLFKDAGAKVLLDADGEPMKLGLEAGPDLIKPNSKEAERLLGFAIGSDTEAIRAVDALHRQGVPMVLLSRGKDGAVLTDGSRTWVGRSPQVDAVSSIGSGDSMLGGFLWGLEERLPIADCLRWGLAAGAATATTGGAEIARQPVVERLLPFAEVHLPTTL
jgi:1-phosphofructokinase family hexose kinase